MRRKTRKNVVVVSLVILCAAVGLQFRASKQKTVATAQPVVAAPQMIAAVEPTAVNRNSFADVEARREQELEDKRNADELAKQQSKKGKSVECLFWKQQKQTSSAANIDEKIEKFCNI